MKKNQSIPQSFIDDLLGRVNLAELVGTRVSLKKSGGNWYGCCPFHQEKTASFSVSEHKQFFYCFGCKASGNAIGFLMDYHNYSFPEAVEQLAEEAGVPMPTLETGVNPRQNQSCHQLMKGISEYYHQNLISTPHAHKYIKERGLSDETIETFQIGYSSPEWDQVKKRFGKRNEHQKDLIRTGMVIEKGQKSYDRFRGRIMFPIHNTQGKIIGFGGRVTDNSSPKYLNSPETELFQKNNELFGLYHARNATTKLDTIIIVEGYMDVIALANHGLRNAVATLGTAITHGHIKKLIKQAQKLIFCFDGDSAGYAAAWKALTIALPNTHDGIEILFCFLPQGEDPDTFTQKHGITGFHTHLNKSMPLSDFLFAKLKKDHGHTSLDQKAAYAKAAKQLINTMPEGIFKSLLNQRIENEIDLKIPPSQQARPSQSKPQTTHKPISQIRQIITAVIHFPTVTKELNEATFNQDTPGETILRELIQLINQHPHIQNTAQLLEHTIDSSWHQTIQRIACEDSIMTQQPSTEDMKVLTKKHLDQKRQELIQALLDKSNHTTLSQQEKKQLQSLIVEQKT